MQLNWHSLMGLRVVAVLVALTIVPVAQTQTASAQRIQIPTLRVQTDRLTRGIQTNIRLARNARLVIKPGEAIEVHALALSSPRFLVTGLGDGSVRIWDLEFGREAATIDAHEGEILDLAIGAGGQFLATAGEDGFARVWQLSNGRRIAEFAAHEGAVTGVAIEPAERTLVTVGEDGMVRVWNIAGASRTAELSGHAGAITSMKMTQDGRFLITGGDDRTVRVWDFEAGTALKTLTGHDRPIVSVAVGTNGKVVAGVGSGGEIVVWDREAGTETLSFQSDSKPLSVAVNDRRGFVGVGGEDAIVRLYDMRSGEESRVFRGHGGPVRHLAFEPTNQFLHTASVDGTSRVWDLPTGDQLAQVISTKSGWVVADASGAYDGSEGGINAVQWQTSEGGFELDQKISEDFEPGVLSQLIDEGAATVRARAAISEGFPVPPRVTIASKGTTTLDGRPAIDLEVVAKNDNSGGVSELRLYHNNRIIGGKTAGVQLVADETEADEHRLRLIVPLVVGQNQFQAIAANEANVESKPASFTVSQSGEGGQGELHLIVVGINEYVNPSLNLNYGVPDGRGIANFFKRVRHLPFEQVKVHEIYDAAATRDGILALLDVVRATKPEDVIMIFFAGHGEAIGRDWYFVPHEVADAADPDVLAAGGINSDHLRDGAIQIGARKIFVMIDTCKSGALLDSFRGFDEIKALRLLAHNAGVHIIASSDNEQLATELSALGHGVFTSAALDGLQGAADAGARDGVVTVDELIDYIRERVAVIAMEHDTVRQTPVSLQEGADFALARTSDG
ncbi:MAG: caspase family protein [Alphaproteobacteria bacterium]